MCADANFRINVVAEQHNIVATSPNHTRQFKPYLTSSVKWAKSLKLWNLLPFTAYYYRGHVLMTLVSTLNTHRTLRVFCMRLFQSVQNSLTFPWLENAFPFFQVFQVFQSEWEPWTLVSTLNTHRTLRVRASNLSCRCYYSLHQKKN